MVFQVGPVGAAQAQVKERRIGIGCQRAVARHAHGNVAKIGERREGTVLLDCAHVARGAVALGRIGKDLQATHLLRRQLDLAAQKRVVLAVVRIELRRRLLKHLQRHQRGAEGGVFVVENIVTKHLTKCLRVAAIAQLGHHRSRRAVGHLVRGEQRDACLVVRGRHTAVPGVAAGRALVFGIVAVVLVEVLGERRHILDVAQ